jgi:hypothetical protein
MTRGRATYAIAAAELRQHDLAADIVVAGALLAVLTLRQPLALGAAIAVLLIAGTFGYRGTAMTSLRYLCAPLYGRELARAYAFALAIRIAATSLLAAAIAVILAASPRTGIHQVPWHLLVASALGVLTTALVAMPAGVRRGRERRLYTALAIGSGLAVDAIGAAGTPLALATAALASVLIGFVALRGLGETLARFDPVD